MRSMKTIQAILLITTLFVVLPARPTQSQTTGDIADLQSAIERNAELLQEATVLVMQTNSTKARAMLESARAQHESSIALAQQDRLALAARAVVAARRAILRTINLAKQEAKLEENAVKMMERAAARLELARSSYEERGDRDDAPARKLIDEAHQQLQQARNHMREHMFGTALQLAQMSLELSNRAIAMLRRDTVDDEDIFRAIERTDNILERVMDIDGRRDAPHMQRALREAQELQNRAKQNARNNEYRPALEQTRRAREIALRLLKSSGGADQPGKSEVRRALRFTEELIAQGYEIARENNLRDAKQQLDEATRVQKGAGQQFGNEHYRAAMRMTLRAREMAKDAVRGMNKPLDPAQVGDALTQTNEALAQLAAKLEGNPNDVAAKLYERARDRQRSAREALDNGELRKALASTRVARNLVRRALQQLNDETGR